jgi:hypothetical protein
MPDPITIRPGEQHDADALRRLAAGDHRSALTGPVLVAVAAGVPLAAIALGSGTVVADRSRPTLDAVRLLRRRRYRLLRQGGDVGSRSLLLRRLGAAITSGRRDVLHAL